MTLEEYNAKIEALKEEGLALTKENKLDEAKTKKAEIEALETQFEQEKDAAALANALDPSKNTFVDLMDNKNEIGKETKKMENYTAASNEYRNAFFKMLNGEELSELENAAFVHTTENSPAVLPTQTLNQIWDLVTGEHAILGDVNIIRSGVAIEVIKHTAIAAGKAKKVNENAANDDEKNTFVKVKLSGNDFSKHVDISYALGKMSVEALEQYLITEIANSLGEAMAEDCVDNAIIANIATANVVAGGITLANIRKAFGALKRATAPVVYCTREVLYNNIVALEDGSGRAVFQASYVPGVAGTLLGAEVKIEDATEGKGLLIGDGKRVTYNMVQDIMIESAKDIKKHVTTYSGYARGEGALIDDKSFAQITLE